VAGPRTETVQPLGAMNVWPATVAEGGRGEKKEKDQTG
jgi:hypothetical protein